MGSLRYDPDHLLFVVLPYLAVAVFFGLLAIRRFAASSAAPPAGPAQRYGERLLFGYGIVVILAGHLLAFLIPEQVRLWTNEPLRRQILEVSGLIFALMTLAGMLLTAARYLFQAEARQGINLSDVILYLFLLVQVGSGIAVAVFYPWGSSWSGASILPYLRSLVRLEPDLNLIATLPHLVKLHLVAAWVLVMYLPLTRVVRPLVAVSAEGSQVRTTGRVMTNILLAGLAVSLLTLVPRLWGAYLPGNHQDYEPVQPIAFSHRQHAGDLQVSCVYCHGDAEKGRHAGIPSANVCMNCHRFVTAPSRDLRAEADLAREEKRPPRTIISPELAKLYAALGLDDKLQRDPDRPTTPIHWLKVHNLPAFTRFDHRAHVTAGVDCQHCHGAVENMDRVRQVEDLSMGWCVQCHRDVNGKEVAGRAVHPSNDCTTCHH